MDRVRVKVSDRCMIRIWLWPELGLGLSFKVCIRFIV